MLAINEILQGRYRILRRLGHGGMGAVYEAMDERFGSTVALKEIIIDSDKAANPSQQTLIRYAFEREARILAHLHHEAFPHVRDYFSETDRQFLVMELIGGDDLAEMLSQRQIPFLLEDVLKWADQLLDALDYLHTLEMPIIHRDIKPQNLKLTARGKIKLLDFGIAKGNDAAHAAANTLTNKTFIAATLNYSPLEQILPVLDSTFREYIALNHAEKVENILQQPTDARSDLYALGTTLYHLSTAVVPVDSLKRTLEIWNGKSDPLPHPSEKNPLIPKEISDVLLKAMAVERENRFATAKEMRDALSRAAIQTQRSVEEEAKYILWLAEQDRLKAEQERLSREIQPPTETQPQQQPPTGVNQPAAEITDSILAAVPTQNSAEFTRQSYLADILPVEQSPPPPPPPQPEPQEEVIAQVTPLPQSPPIVTATAAASVVKNTTVIPPRKNRPAALWILPLAFLLLLMAGAGIFGMWWILGKRAAKSDASKPPRTTTETPAPSAAASETPVAPTPEPTQEGSIVAPSTEAPTATTNAAPTPKTKTTVTPQMTQPQQTATPSVRQTPTPIITTPTRTPPPVRTPTPARTPATQPPRPPRPGCTQSVPPGCRQLPNCIIEC